MWGKNGRRWCGGKEEGSIAEDKERMGVGSGEGEGAEKKGGKSVEQQS